MITLRVRSPTYQSFLHTLVDISMQVTEFLAFHLDTFLERSEMTSTGYPLVVNRYLLLPATAVNRLLPTLLVSPLVRRVYIPSHSSHIFRLPPSSLPPPPPLLSSPLLSPPLTSSLAHAGDELTHRLSSLPASVLAGLPLAHITIHRRLHNIPLLPVKMVTCHTRCLTYSGTDDVCCPLGSSFPYRRFACQSQQTCRCIGRYRCGQLQPLPSL